MPLFSGCWDLEIPVDFSDDWILHLTFYILGICHNFKTSNILGLEQLKIIVVVETELNTSKIKKCTVPMNLRYFAKDKCDLSWFTVTLPIKSMWEKKVNSECYLVTVVNFLGGDIRFLKCIKISKVYINYFYKPLQCNKTAWVCWKSCRDVINVLFVIEQQNKVKLRFSWIKLIAECFIGMCRITFTNPLNLPFDHTRI